MMLTGLSGNAPLSDIDSPLPCPLSSSVARAYHIGRGGPCAQ